jgi:hypothetical protein
LGGALFGKSAFLVPGLRPFQESNAVLGGALFGKSAFLAPGLRPFQKSTRVAFDFAHVEKSAFWGFGRRFSAFGEQTLGAGFAFWGKVGIS